MHRHLKGRPSAVASHEWILMKTEYVQSNMFYWENCVFSLILCEIYEDEFHSKSRRMLI